MLWKHKQKNSGQETPIKIGKTLSNYNLKNYLSLPCGIVHHIKTQTVIYHEF